MYELERWSMELQRCRPEDLHYPGAYEPPSSRCMNRILLDSRTICPKEQERMGVKERRSVKMQGEVEEKGMERTERKLAQAAKERGKARRTTKTINNSNNNKNNNNNNNNQPISTY